MQGNTDQSFPGELLKILDAKKNTTNLTVSGINYSTSSDCTDKWGVSFSNEISDSFDKKLNCLNSIPNKNELFQARISALNGLNNAAIVCSEKEGQYLWENASAHASTRPGQELIKDDGSKINHPFISLNPKSEMPITKGKPTGEELQKIKDTLFLSNPLYSLDTF